MTPPSTPTPSAPTAGEFAELRRQFEWLKELVALRGIENSTPCQPALTDDQIVGDRASFKYRYLSNLMTGVNASKLNVTVERYGDGDSLGLRLKQGQSGPSDGKYLAGAGISADGARKEFSLALDEGAVTGEDLRCAGVDPVHAFEQFFLRTQAKGPMVAVAPELPAVPTVTVIRDANGGLLVQRCGVPGGTYLAGVACKQGGTRVSFEIALSADKISQGALRNHNIEATDRFEPFALHQGEHGPVVAVANGLT